MPAIDSDSSFNSQTSTILREVWSQIQHITTDKNPALDNTQGQTYYDEIFPSNHPFLFPQSQNTPLTAQESNLFTDDYTPDMLGNRGPDFAALGWIIPTTIGIVAAMVILGLLCFFGVRALELKCTRCCQTNCSCCCEAGEETDALTSTRTINQTEMTNYKSAFSPDGDEW